MPLGNACSIGQQSDESPEDKKTRNWAGDAFGPTRDTRVGCRQPNGQRFALLGLQNLGKGMTQTAGGQADADGLHFGHGQILRLL